MHPYYAFAHLLARSEQCKVVLKFVRCSIFFTDKVRTKHLTKIEQVSEFFKKHDLDNMIKCRFDAFFESSIELDKKIKLHKNQSENTSLKRPIEQGFELNFEYDTAVFNFYDKDFDEKNTIKTHYSEAFEFLFWRVLTSWFDNETPNIIEMKLEIKKRGDN